MHLPICDPGSENKLCRLSFNLLVFSILRCQVSTGFWKTGSVSHSLLTGVNEFLPKIYTFLNLLGYNPE
jgi:hypothetical protein